jgi:hypothetical protein
MTSHHMSNRQAAYAAGRGCDACPSSQAATITQAVLGSASLDEPAPGDRAGADFGLQFRAGTVSYRHPYFDFYSDMRDANILAWAIL